MLGYGYTCHFHSTSCTSNDEPPFVILLPLSDMMDISADQYGYFNKGDRSVRFVNNLIIFCFLFI